MHGLIFVIWEKYLGDRFGPQVLFDYRTAIGETPADAPLATRMYTDERLLEGVGVASQLTQLSAETLLREYGRYFIINGLTNYLCAYYLTKVHSGRELLLIMRMAHAQMRNLPDGVTPPLFEYAVHPTNPDILMLTYSSPRKLCALLFGAIEGSAQRFGDHVEIVEHTCMHRGADACRFEIHFTTSIRPPTQAPENEAQEKQRVARQRLMDYVLLILPGHEEQSITLMDIHGALQSEFGQLRLNILFEAIQHLQHAGLVGSTVNRPGDNLTNRRYWRVSVVQGEPIYR
jgi:hypothetical protein